MLVATSLGAPPQCELQNEMPVLLRCVSCQDVHRRHDAPRAKFTRRGGKTVGAQHGTDEEVAEGPRCGKADLIAGLQRFFCFR